MFWRCLFLSNSHEEVEALSEITHGLLFVNRRTPCSRECGHSRNSANMKDACGLPRAPVFIGAADARHPGVHSDWTHVVAELLDRCLAMI